MRFTAYQEDGRRGLALHTAEGLRGLAEGDAGAPQGDAGAPPTLEELLAEGPESLRAMAMHLRESGRALDPARIELLPPLARPGKIVCIGLNYRDHSKESGFEQPAYPTVFGRFASSLIGQGAPLVRPAVSTQFDWEGELAAVIGKGGRHIAEAEALDHVAGYAVFNDVSVRDFQFKSPQWTVGKNFDATGAFGPDFVTADEVPPGCRGLMLETRLNGEVVQRAAIDDMVFGVAALVSILSEAITLEPGDVIVTGTPAGVGLGRTPPRFMAAGDVIEVEIDGVGRLTNPVIDETVQKIETVAS